MRAIMTDDRLNAVRCSWEGTPSSSPSRLEVNGTTYATNLHPNPGATRNITNFSFWTGGGANVAAKTISPAQWSKSNSAARVTWTKTALTDKDYSVMLHPAVSPSGTFTVKFVSMFHLIPNGDLIPVIESPRVFSNVTGVATMINRSRNSNTSPSLGEVVVSFVTFVAPSTIPSDLRASTTMRNFSDGSYVETSMVDLYPGGYKQRDWFSGDTKGEELLSLSLSLS